MIETDQLAARVQACSHSCQTNVDQQIQQAMQRWADKKRQLLETAQSDVSEDQLDVRICRQNEYWYVEATAQLPAWTLAATHHSHDLHRAIDAVADKLSRQLLQLEPSYRKLLDRCEAFPRLMA